MKDRIKKIMESENLTPARFADRLKIGRAVVSHILKGRNNPSLEVITRILTQMPHINSEWLLKGAGNMYKEDSKETEPASPYPGFFAAISQENSINPVDMPNENKYRTENIVNDSINSLQKSIAERVIYKDRSPKKIKQIIIYYSDNTFETFSQE